MPKLLEFTFAGRECKAAPPPFSEEACELVELFEEAGVANELSSAGGAPSKFRKNGRLLTLMRRVAKDCLVRGGHTEVEANEILLSVSMDDSQDHGIPALASALGLT